MQISEILILIIILLLAIPFGYFLHKGISKIAFEKLLEKLEQLKLINSQQKILISQLKEEVATTTEALENLQKEFFQLTLTSQQLQQKESALQKQILEKQYDVPPDYKHLQESNALLQEEIQRSRAKVKTWKKKDFKKENKKLVKEVKKLNKSILALRKENEKLNHSHRVLSKIKKLTTVEEPIAREVLPKMKPVKNNKKKGKKSKKIKKNEANNIFKHQPEFKKNQIFKELFNENKEEAVTPIIDLNNSDKTLIDLVGLDENALKILQSKGIHTFNEMVQMKIRNLSEIFESEEKKYPYETWPIQSRLALRGEWELIEEYKDKN
jgi:hypothetical protein